ncbi:P-loop containing nucleoside triphosphate hydrolase protein [Hypoxylon sp. FL1150]|nr:P-loop containing nucleoside triphosphate hydrolase protein [Hypoxylon sp. FL1150]
MDPLTMIQLVGTALSVGDIVVRCITGLTALKSKYHNAPIIVSAMIGQLYMVQSALDQLPILKSPELRRSPRYQQLASQVHHALGSFGPLMKALGEELDRLNKASPLEMKAKSRLTFLWSEKDMNNFSTFLDRQVNALNLLLQAIQCQTWAEQQEVMDREESQSILQLAQDYSSSIVGLDDTSSFTSEDTTGVSARFDFDPIILRSRLYQKAERSHLRQAIRAGRSPAPNGITITTEQYNEKIAEEKSPDEQSEEASIQIAESSQKDGTSRKIQPSSTPDELSPGPSSPTTALSSDSSGFGQFTRRSKSSRSIKLSYWWKPFQRRDSNITGLPSEPRKVELLGISGSGKSTLHRRLLLAIQPNIFSEKPELYSHCVWRHAISSARSILEAMKRMENPIMSEHEVEKVFAEMCQYSSKAAALFPPSRKLVDAIASIWTDDGFQEAYKRRSEYQLNDNMAYFITSMKRIAAPEYVPTDEDILRTRTETPEVAETILEYASSKYTIVDGPGKLALQGGWGKDSEHISTLLFTFDPTAYPPVSPGGGSVDRMQKQFTMFESTVNNRRLSQTDIIVVITKMDLLEAYLRDNDANAYFGPESSLDTVEKYTQ